MELPIEKYYTYADCLSWGEDVRAEIIYGELYMKSLPLRVHQEILGNLLYYIGKYCKDKPCEVYPGPFGVRLFEQDGDRPEDVDTLVEPDISVICDKSKLDDYGCKGAPDFIIEILSPSSRRHDKITKLYLYKEAGVREYWIVDPESRSVDVFLFGEFGDLTPAEVYTSSETAKITVLNDCPIDLKAVFPENE